MQSMNDVWGQLISIRQLWAEINADLGKLGNRESWDLSRRLFADLIRDYPWWTAGLVQACYMASKDGEHEQAVDMFRKAQTLSPLHHHVIEARDRLFGESKA